MYFTGNELTECNIKVVLLRQVHNDNLVNLYIAQWLLRALHLDK